MNKHSERHISNFKRINYKEEVWSNGKCKAKGVLVPKSIKFDASFKDMTTLVRHGVWEFYNRDGSLQKTVNFKRGKKHGRYEKRKGEQVHSKNYVNGVRSGEQRVLIKDKVIERFEC